jgi:hypothetical protein
VKDGPHSTARIIVAAVGLLRYWWVVPTWVIQNRTEKEKFTVDIFSLHPSAMLSMRHVYVRETSRHNLIYFSHHSFT